MGYARRFTDGAVPICVEGYEDENVVKRQDSQPSADGIHDLLCLTWEPPAGTEVRGIIQIVHGMIEFVDRYDDIARCFAANGFIVTGEDHLGHGGSVKSEEEWGQLPGKEGATFLVEDVHNLRVRTQQRYGNSLPYIMYGHSMGSFITRSYLMTHGDGLAGAIVSGTGQTPLATSRMAAFIAHVIGLFHGKNYHSPFINNLGFGAYNKAFEPVRTPFDWLSKDEKVVDIYAAEPRDTFTFTVNGYLTLFALTARIVKQGNVDLAPKDIPLLFAAGGDDPVGESGKGVWAAANQFRTAGNTHVYVRIYPGDRHEIHNELDRKQVYVDFLDWIDAVLAGNPPADNTEDPAFLGDPPADEEEGDTL